MDERMEEETMELLPETQAPFEAEAEALADAPPEVLEAEAPVPEDDGITPDDPALLGGEKGLKKALRDTKAWATRLAQDNVELRRALEASLGGTAARLSSPLVAEKLERTKKALSRFAEFEPLMELVETVVRGVGEYEREVAHHALIQAVLAEHPDALDLRGDAAFLEWVGRQPPIVHDCLAGSQNPSEVNWAIGLYKRERDGEKSREARRDALTERESRMRRAATPTGRGGKAPAAPKLTRDEIARMTLEEFRRREAEIDRALSRGEID